MKLLSLLQLIDLNRKRTLFYYVQQEILNKQHTTYIVHITVVQL